MTNTLIWLCFLATFLTGCGLPSEPNLSAVLAIGPSKFVTDEEWDVLAAQRTACPGEGSVLDAETRGAVVSCNQSLQYYDRFSSNTDGSGVPGSCTGQVLAPIPCDIGQFNKFLPDSLVASLNEVLNDPAKPLFRGQLDQCVLITQPSDPRLNGSEGRLDLDINNNTIFICYFATTNTSGSGIDYSQFLIIPLNAPIPAKFYN